MTGSRSKGVTDGTRTALTTPTKANARARHGSLPNIRMGLQTKLPPRELSADQAPKSHGFPRKPRFHVLSYVPATRPDYLRHGVQGQGRREDGEIECQTY